MRMKTSKWIGKGPQDGGLAEAIMNGLAEAGQRGATCRALVASSVDLGGPGPLNSSHANS